MWSESGGVGIVVVGWVGWVDGVDEEEDVAVPGAVDVTTDGAVVVGNTGVVCNAEMEPEDSTFGSPVCSVAIGTADELMLELTTFGIVATGRRVFGREVEKLCEGNCGDAPSDCTGAVATCNGACAGRCSSGCVGTASDGGRDGSVVPTTPASGAAATVPATATGGIPVLVSLLFAAGVPELVRCCCCCWLEVVAEVVAVAEDKGCGLHKRKLANTGSILENSTSVIVCCGL